MAATPSFINQPRVNLVYINTTNTNIDGSGDIAFLQMGSGNGSRVLEISVTANGTVTAGMVNIFITEDGGTTWRLFDQIYMPAATPSTSTKASRNFATYTNLVLTNSQYQLGVASNCATTNFTVVALGGDL